MIPLIPLVADSPIFTIARAIALTIITVLIIKAIEEVKNGKDK